MRNTLSLLFVLLITCTPSAIAAPWSTGDKVNNQFAIPQYNQHSIEPSRGYLRWLPQLTWLRNAGITKLYGAPSKATKSASDGRTKQPSSSKLPAKLLAHYGKDVVLRFNISTPYEEQMLAEAADHLLLDVWEFTDNWADIRLREDTVRPANPHLQSGSQHIYIRYPHSSNGFRNHYRRHTHILWLIWRTQFINNTPPATFILSLLP